MNIPFHGWRRSKLTAKHIFICCVFWAFAFTTYASYIERLPITVTQPDGTEVHCFASGDEFYNWIHDANGYTLIRDPETGIVVYAKLQNDELVSTGYQAGSIDPASIGLKPWTIISAERREQLRNDFLSEGPPARFAEGEQTEIMPAGQNNGTLNNLVIYIRFSDQTEFSAKGNTYNDMFNREATNFSSLYGYFKAASNGKTLITSTFYPTSTGNTIISYQDSYPRSYFLPYNATTNPDGWQGGNDDSERRKREHQLLKRTVEAVRSQIPTTLNLDFDNDGRVDNICFIIRGATGEWSALLWPHRWSLYSETVQINGKRVYDYNFQVETNTDGSGASVLVHEMFHTLGAPDLYRYTETSITPVGTWDVMASNQNPPQSSTAYVKYKYGGWIDDIPEITKNGTYTLNNVWSPTNNAYKIASPNSTTEFFVIEYRDKSIYWDSKIPNSGLLIYRVNTAAKGNSDGPPDEVYIFRQGGTNNTTNGTINNAHFSSGSGRTTFNNTSNPPCFLSDNKPGGIDIRAISASGGTTMSFQVVMTAHTIDASAGPGGTISPSGKFTVTPGSNTTFTITPNQGKVIDMVLVDGVNVPEAVTSGKYTFNNIAANHTISVSFSCPVQSLPLAESFNNSTFPPDCWISESAVSSPWKRVTTGTYPTCSPKSSPGMLQYNSYSYASGRSGLLITPKIVANNSNCRLTFWMYRENGSSNNADKVNVYLSSTQSITGLTPLRTINRSRTLAPVENTNGWYEYTIDLPTASMSSAYVIFEGVSARGYNIYLDDIKIERTYYDINLSETDNYTFASATYGYVMPNTLTVTVTNTGNQPTGTLTVALSGDNSGNFDLSKTSITNIVPTTGSNTATFTVTPKTGLVPGIYTATIEVSGGNDITASFNISFTVNKKPVTITGITATKTYDGTADFTNEQIDISNTTIIGKVGNDDVTAVKTGITGSYGPNVETGILSFSGDFTLGGVNAAYYTLSGQPTVTATITKATGNFDTPDDINTTYTTTLTLSDLTLPEGYTWDNSEASLNAGDGQIFAAVYTDPSGNYLEANGTITVNVAKAVSDFGTPDDINTTYTTTLTLADLTLPEGYTWDEAETSLNAGDGQIFAAVYTNPSGNYLEVNGMITVNVAKAAGDFGTPDTINTTYTTTLTLADLTLPEGYTWDESETSLNAGDRQIFAAVYTDPSGNYLEANGTITVNVAKSTGDFGTPDDINTTYTTALTLADLTLPEGYSWDEAETSLNAGDRQIFAAVYTDPSGNYLEVNGMITVNVAKAAGDFGTPDDINTTYTTTLTLADLTLPEGYTWNDSETSLNAGNGQIFAAVYTDPSGNYLEVTGTITVNVAKAAGSFITPDAIEITYSDGLILSDLVLPEGYTWNNPTTLLDVGNEQIFSVTYTHPSGNYLDVTDVIRINVAKTTTTLFIHNTVNETYTITPNPTQGQLTINNEQLITDNIQVFDLYGKLVLQTNENPFDISALPEGVYLVKVNDKIVKVIKK